MSSAIDALKIENRDSIVTSKSQERSFFVPNSTQTIPHAGQIKCILIANLSECGTGWLEVLFTDKRSIKVAYKTGDNNMLTAIVQVLSVKYNIVGKINGSSKMIISIGKSCAVHFTKLSSLAAQDDNNVFDLDGAHSFTYKIPLDDPPRELYITSSGRTPDSIRISYRPMPGRVLIQTDGTSRRTVPIKDVCRYFSATEKDSFDMFVADQEPEIQRLFANFVSDHFTFTDQNREPVKFSTWTDNKEKRVNVIFITPKTQNNVIKGRA